MGKVQRFGSVSRLKPDRAEYYQQLHAAPWKQINDMIIWTGLPGSGGRISRKSCSRKMRDGFINCDGFYH